jgi:hypothetical protein
MRIGIFGDVHCNHEIFYEMLMSAVEKHNITAAIQVGDFSFSKEILKHPELNNLHVPLYVIDGNHEDFKFLNKSSSKGEYVNWASNNLHYQSRGSTIVLDGIRIGFIGGAMNVNRPQRMIGGNIISDDDIRKTLKEFSANPPDIVVSHSCPAGIGVGMLGNPEHRMGIYYNIIIPGYDPGPFDDCGETQLASLWKGMAKKPQLWIFGHFHRFHKQRVVDTDFISMPSVEKTVRQVLLWDTDAKDISDSLTMQTL